jgi:hypothetical protein
VTVPLALTCRIDCPLGQLDATRACTCPVLMSAEPIVPSTMLVVVTALASATAAPQA